MTNEMNELYVMSVVMVSITSVLPECQEIMTCKCQSICIFPQKISNKLE